MKKNILLSQSVLPIRRIAYRVLGALDRIVGRKSPQVFVLCYHSASDDGGRFSMDADTIRTQIEWLCAQYTAVSLADIIDFIEGKKVFSTSVFAITFDDGYESLMKIRDLPELLHTAPTVFALALTNDALRKEIDSNESFLTSEQLRELHALGWDIGCHSATHPNFRTLSNKGLRMEIADAKKSLEHDTGVPISHFAYPKGVYTDEAIAMVKQAGFVSAWSMDDGALNSGMSVYTLPRIGVDKTHQMSEFKVLWSPILIWLRKAIKNHLAL